MPSATLPLNPRPSRIGSLFSGYGGLDLAVEHVTAGETVWFSELNDPVARIFAHHWPEAPNLGDITTVDWNKVAPVDVLCGGFPCQDISTVGKQAGLAPGTRSGLWSHMAEAIDVLHPRQVVIENVRGLLSAHAIRPQMQGATSHERNSATPSPATPGDLESATWGLGDDATRPLRALGAVLGDLADLRYDTKWVGLPASAVGAPHHRFRVFILATRHDIVSDASSVGFLSRRRDIGSGEGSARDDRAIASGDRPGLARAGWLTGQKERSGHLVVASREHFHRWGRYAQAIARWEHVSRRAAPAPAFLVDCDKPRPAPEFVEWLMGLPAGWITDSEIGLTSNQTITALGNGVLPLQAMIALEGLGLEAAAQS
ncbi:DNA cytosine methyltransferase [Paramicrobacterium fandaimingii]|uniref:DNA cytosine methyltransferase n=1 Tax=Paramicrobacterium fandaimingii TaxID=2708079 RepID=UPI00141E087D|nr:DNA cytosine methyltransferase [Microbacterium fandaimingii]